MAVFYGSSGHDYANASTGILTGFTGGTLQQLMDASGDQFQGWAGNDTIYAGSGNDEIAGYDGADQLYGGGGNDSFVYGYTANDMAAGEVIDGGSGIDRLQVTGTQPRFVNFTSATINSIESFDFLNSGHSAAFNANQIGTGLSTNLIVGNAHLGSLYFYMGTSTSISLENFVFLNQPYNLTISGDASSETITGSQVNDTIYAGAGDDTIYGENGDDVIHAGAGRDLSFGDGGADTFIVIGNEFVSGELIWGDLGGPGQDKLFTIGDVNYALGSVVSIEALEFGDYFGSGLSASARFNANQFSAAGVSLNLAVSGHTAIANDIIIDMGSSTSLNISGFTLANWTPGTDDIIVNGDSDAETITGTTQNDTIFGSGGTDTLNGNAGADLLSAGSHNDIVVGGAGADILIGGSGRDTMTGDGAGIANSADDFRFESLSQLGNTAATRDIITDFVAGSDDLDFQTFDANSVAAGVQDFVWRGTSAFSAAGQLRYIHQANGAGTADDRTIVQGNLDNNLTTVEFEIELYGLLSLTAGDVIA